MSIDPAIHPSHDVVIDFPEAGVDRSRVMSVSPGRSASGERVTG
jgi:hypothetical protein